MLHDIEVVEWKNFEDKARFSHIVNTIGCKHKIFTHENFFSSWSSHKKRYYIDLGSPSTIDTFFDISNSVARLDDIFKEGAVEESKKREQIAKVQLKMNELVNRREELFEEKARKAKLFRDNIHAKHNYF
jgi:glutamyl-tRNA reductase